MKEQEMWNNILQLDADQLHHWVWHVLAGKEKASDQFNWLGLAEHTALKAQVNSKAGVTEVSMKWARISLRIYHYLIEKSSGSTRFSLECSAVNLQISFIVKKGAIADDTLLDIDQIIHWFFQDLKISPLEAEQKSSYWKALDSKEISELRRIKNKLSRLNILFLNNQIPAGSGIQEWISILDKLP